MYRLTNGTAYIAQMIQQLINIYIWCDFPYFGKAGRVPCVRKQPIFHPRNQWCPSLSVISSECMPVVDVAKYQLFSQSLQSPWIFLPWLITKKCVYATGWLVNLLIQKGVLTLGNSVRDFERFLRKNRYPWECTPGNVPTAKWNGKFIKGIYCKSKKNMLTNQSWSTDNIKEFN